MIAAHSNPPRLMSPTQRTWAVLLALLLYLVWALVTYLLEGRLRTFLRPEAREDRLAYALVANLAIGVVAAAVLLRYFLRWRVVTLKQVGLRALRHTLVCSAVAMALGVAAYGVLRPASLNPIVVGNVFAQTLNVSAAEVLVCWAATGPLLRVSLRLRPPSLSVPVAVLVCSTLFGVYHFAHSVPFNSPRVVIFLSAVGLFTSVFYFFSRDLYATVLFHNWLGVVGVTQALAESGRLSTFETPLPMLHATAAFGVVLLVALDVLWLRRGPRAARPGRPHSR
jgi:hypothetical protein